jgi:hypothetical protein
MATAIERRQASIGVHMSPTIRLTLTRGGSVVRNRGALNADQYNDSTDGGIQGAGERIEVRRGRHAGRLRHLLGRLFVDDGWLAAGIVSLALGAWSVEARYPLMSAGACLLFASGMPALLAFSALRRAARA